MDLPASAPEWPDDVVMPEKMHVVAIEMFGKYRVDAAINSRNLIQRFKTTVNIEFSDFVAVFDALGDEARSLHAAVESEGSQSTSAGYRSAPSTPTSSHRGHGIRADAPSARTEQRPRGAKTVRYSGDRTEQPTSPSRFAARTGRECSACRRPHRASGRAGRVHAERHIPREPTEYRPICRRYARTAPSARSHQQAHLQVPAE